MAKVVRAISSNPGIRSSYTKRLLKELEAMQHSIAYWLKSAYTARESEIVSDNAITGDASPVWAILARFNSDQRRWLKRWNKMANWLGKWFVNSIDRQTSTSLAAAFKDAGFTVKFNPNRVTNMVSQALIAENVDLIKSIPQQYLNDVKGIVTRGVSAGHDFGYIAEELGKRYEITQRRAKLIARDQTDKATQSIARTRDQELGITEGIWEHWPGKHTSRETHRAMNGKRFKLSEGLYDSSVKRNVLPGELVACRCKYRRIIPELGEAS